MAELRDVYPVVRRVGAGRFCRKVWFEIGDDNLDVQRRNVITDGLPGDGYDLIHARLLLMHLPTREKLLEEMAAALRPGGWLLVEDMDVFPFSTLAEDRFDGAVRELNAAFAVADEKRIGHRADDSARSQRRRDRHEVVAAECVRGHRHEAEDR